MNNEKRLTTNIKIGDQELKVVRQLLISCHDYKRRELQNRNHFEGNKNSSKQISTIIKTRLSAQNEKSDTCVHWPSQSFRTLANLGY